jgi:flagellar protein FlbD
MVLVTRINKVEQFYVNEDMIEFIEETPDTVISLNTGKKIVVMESAETVISKIREQKSMILRSITEGRPPVRRDLVQ